MSQIMGKNAIFDNFSFYERQTIHTYSKKKNF